MTGPVADQAVLYGLLRMVRDLGMRLLSVNRVGTGKPDRSTGEVWTSTSGAEKEKIQ
jgi:hypothetical protein